MVVPAPNKNTPQCEVCFMGTKEPVLDYLDLFDGVLLEFSEADCEYTIF